MTHHLELLYLIRLTIAEGMGLRKSRPNHSSENPRFPRRNWTLPWFLLSRRPCSASDLSDFSSLTYRTSGSAIFHYPSPTPFLQAPPMAGCRCDFPPMTCGELRGNFAT